MLAEKFGKQPVGNPFFVPSLEVACRHGEGNDQQFEDLRADKERLGLMRQNEGRRAGRERDESKDRDPYIG